MAIRSVFDPDISTGPTQSSGGSQSSSTQDSNIYEQRKVGINLLGQEPEYKPTDGPLGIIGDLPNLGRSAVGLAGDILYNTIDVPNRIAQMEIAKNRLNHAMAFGDPRVAQKYIGMVEEQNMSLDSVAEQMYKDGVALTGGTGHDLIASLFLDPLNFIAPAVGGAYQRGKKASGLLDVMGESTAQDVFGRVRARTTLSTQDEHFLNSRVNRVLGETYGKISRKLSGGKKGFAQAIFGVAADKILLAVGINTMRKIAEAADVRGFGALFDDSVARAAAHTMRGAAANHIVNQSIVRNTTALAGRVEAVNRLGDIGEQAARQQFLAASRLDEASAVLTDDEILKEFDALVTLKSETPSGANWKQRAINEGVQSAVQTELGPLVGGNQQRLLNAFDDTVVKNRKSVERELDNIFARESADSQLIVDQGIDAVKAEVAGRLGFLMDEADAYKIVDDVLAEAGGDFVAARRALVEVLNTSGFVRLGHANTVLGSDLAVLRKMVDGGKISKVFAKIDPKLRTIVRSQIGRLTIVGGRTMTELDKQTIIAALNATDDINQQAAIVQDAIRSFDNLGAEYQALGDATKTVVDSGVIDDVRRTLDDLTDLPEEIPVTWTKALADVPEYQNAVSNARRLGYKVILEPDGIVNNPAIRAIDRGTRTAIKPRVSLWVPITDDGMDVVFGTRNRLGQYVDYAIKNRSTVKIMQNTLDRMYEYAAKSGVGGGNVSRNIIRELHSTIMDEAFRSKGSLRTVALALEGEGDQAVKGILNSLRDKIKARGPEAVDEFDKMVHRGALQDMIFYAARGDLEQVGFGQAATGWIKWRLFSGNSLSKVAAEALTKWTDWLYPNLKFSWSPIFWTMEYVESKFFNALRGIYPEWKVGGKDITRFGAQRYYDVIDPISGKNIRIDAVKVIQDYAAANRPELKFAQEMAALNHFLGYKATDAILSSSTLGDVVTKGFAENRSFWARGYGAVGIKKAEDFWKLTTESNINRLAESLPTLMSTHAPVQWATWLEAAGGDTRGAALLMLHQTQALRAERQVVGQYLKRNRPLGLGFGRQYDDDPIKTLRIATKEARSAVKSGKQGAGITQLADRLVDVRSTAKAVGYSDEAIGELDDAIRLLRAVPANKPVARGTMAKVDAALNATGNKLDQEFRVAVDRRKFVQSALEGNGIPQNVAREMSSLFVVAQRRGEMLPELTVSIEKALESGAALDVRTIDKLQDHLKAIREIRSGEETVINAVMDGIENQIRHESMMVHFYNTERSFAERSLNHIIFSLYPTSYMFGKVFPEYMRLLYATRTKSIAGALLTPYDRILRLASGNKFSLKGWSDYAPLVGFNAAYKVRQDMLREMDTNTPGEYSPTIFLLTQVLIPGLPTDITVSASPIITNPIQTIGKGIEEGRNPVDIAIRSGQSFVSAAERSGQRAVGPLQVFSQGQKILGEARRSVEQSGGPVESIQVFVGETLDNIGRVIFNK